jgi:hypothetical protein
MADADFDGLLKRMPDIAQVVNAFQSEAVQREAFLSLVDALSGHPYITHRHPPEPEHREEAPVEQQVRTRNTGAQGSEAKRNGRRKRESNRSLPKFIRDLDLSPSGKKSFQHFIEEKRPKSNEDKYAVVIYYLQHELELNPVKLDHVFSVFRLTSGWKEPANILSGITTAASRKGTIDTRDLDDLKTTPKGRNFVEHELPPKDKK